MRIGHGYDVHRLTRGRPLILGGVEIESEVGLDGHSDADVLAHAITDAILGAAAMGDIGAHFPDTDPKWKGADSIELLREIVRRVRAEGWAVGNVDATVVLQAPKLRPHIDAMRQRLAPAARIALALASSIGPRIRMISSCVSRAPLVSLIAASLLRPEPAIWPIAVRPVPANRRG